MPKVERARVKYHDKAPPLKPEPFKFPEPEDDPAAGASRGKRKRAQRREDFMRKFEFVSFVERQEEMRQNGSLDLGDIAGGLESALAEGAASAAQPAQAKRPGRKAEAAATEREMAQYQGVLQVDAFKQDPLGALEQHLKNSLKRQEDEERRRQKEADAGGGRKRR